MSADPGRFQVVSLYPRPDITADCVRLFVSRVISSHRTKRKSGKGGSAERGKLVSIDAVVVGAGVLGFGVGAGVGWAMGRAVSFGVGTGVGFRVGVTVGFRVEATTVGLAVGATVGLAVGAAVAAVGFGVGCTVGVDVGFGALEGL
jgi:hypothetical protein